MTETPLPRRASDVLRDRGLTPRSLYEPLPDQHMNAEAVAAWRRDRGERQFATATAVPARFRYATADNPAVADWVTRYLLDPAVAGSLLMLGNTGTGKSWQAYGAIRAVVTSGIAVRWRATSATKLYASLRPGACDDFEATFTAWSSVSLLLLDDLGAAKSSDWVEDVTCRLIDERYNGCLPTLITSNLPPAKLRDMFGDRTASRLNDMCTRIKFDGPDLRRLP